jgi:hypothetical protein
VVGQLSSAFVASTALLTHEGSIRFEDMNLYKSICSYVVVVVLVGGGNVEESTAYASGVHPM